MQLQHAHVRRGTVVQCCCLREQKDGSLGRGIEETLSTIRCLELELTRRERTE